MDIYRFGDHGATVLEHVKVSGKEHGSVHPPNSVVSHVMEIHLSFLFVVRNIVQVFTCYIDTDIHVNKTILKKVKNDFKTIINLT
jgi:hypothetical protein